MQMRTTLDSNAVRQAALRVNLRLITQRRRERPSQLYRTRLARPHQRQHLTPHFEYLSVSPPVVAAQSPTVAAADSLRKNAERNCRLNSTEFPSHSLSVYFILGDGGIRDLKMQDMKIADEMARHEKVQSEKKL